MNCTRWHVDVCDPSLTSPPLDRDWQVLLISLWLPRISVGTLARLVVPGDEGPSGARGALWRCGRTALQSRSSSTIRNTSISVPKSNFELTDRHTRVPCHIDGWRPTAARPTLSALKGVLNPLMARQFDTEREARRPQRSSGNRDAPATWWH